MLNCSTDTIQRMLRAGKIPGFKVGSEWRADPDKVLLSLSNNCPAHNTLAHNTA